MKIIAATISFNILIWLKNPSAVVRIWSICIRCIRSVCVCESKWLRLIEPLVRLNSDMCTTRTPQNKNQHAHIESQWELSGSKLKFMAIIWKYRSLLVGRNLKWSQIVVWHHPKNWKYLYYETTVEMIECIHKRDGNVERAIIWRRESRIESLFCSSL